MILNDETFSRVATLTGYQRSQYNGAANNLVKFKVYDGLSAEFPTRAIFVWVTEDFTVDHYEDVRVLTSDKGWITIPR